MITKTVLSYALENFHAGILTCTSNVYTKSCVRVQCYKKVNMFYLWHWTKLQDVYVDAVGTDGPIQFCIMGK